MIDYESRDSYEHMSWESVTSPLDRLQDEPVQLTDPLGISHQPP